ERFPKPMQAGSLFCSPAPMLGVTYGGHGTAWSVQGSSGNCTVVSHRAGSIPTTSREIPLPAPDSADRFPSNVMVPIPIVASGDEVCVGIGNRLFHVSARGPIENTELPRVPNEIDG